MQDYISLYKVLLAVNRWLTMLTVAQETVSSHMHIVALLSYDLAKSYNIKVDEKKLLLMSITHDLDELYTGDIPSNAKHALDIDLFQKSIPELQSFFSTSFMQEIKKLYNNKDSLEYKLVKVADNLCVLLKAKIELSFGNSNFTKPVTTTVLALKEYQEIPELKAMINDILRSFV